MASLINFLISSGSKKKEPRYICLSEAKVSHSHKMRTEVSSSVPHFLQLRLLLSSITYKCPLKVLCPVRRPMTPLDCVLLKDSNEAPVARLGSESILERVCVYYKDHVTIPNAGFPSSVLSLDERINFEYNDLQLCSYTDWRLTYMSMSE
jgi:hypothetical protein